VRISVWVPAFAKIIYRKKNKHSQNDLNPNRNQTTTNAGEISPVSRSLFPLKIKKELSKCYISSNNNNICIAEEKLQQQQLPAL